MALVVTPRINVFGAGMGSSNVRLLCLSNLQEVLLLKLNPLKFLLEMLHFIPFLRQQSMSCALDSLL